MHPWVIWNRSELRVAGLRSAVRTAPRQPRSARRAPLPPTGWPSWLTGLFRTRATLLGNGPGRAYGPGHRAPGAAR